jgi:RNA-directed DNA polymerase
VSEPKPKSFEISKQAVWEAYRRVRANKGGAGVDEQSIEEFEEDLEDVRIVVELQRRSSG